ncbi:hypothetical protein L6164_019115 [Bauhinia variegata]|uniref:Uncharacterized protein n=1 Tax=Bauhinia variegata TaxID=167791 RepID=A0ACB9NDE8_BAUVA|nr:hypothetical protein L6164_019115 [Bauhinia variegata]
MGIRSLASEEYLILEQFFGYFFGSIDVKHVEPIAVLHIESLGHALHAFINGKLSGSGIGNNSTKAKVIVEIPSTLIAGKNTIDLLILTVGLKKHGAFFDTWGAGIIGPVQLKGLKNGGTLDLSSQQWTYQLQALEHLMELVGTSNMDAAAAIGLSIVQACIETSSCRIGVSTNAFGDPYRGVTEFSS